MLKRLFDASAAALGLLLLAPLMLVIAVAVKLDSPGPALFRQVRVGRDGRTFTILKFRTMRTAMGRAATGALGPQITAAGDSRVTRVGARLREWKLDEIPQLCNVLVGDMSLVGPRPEVPRFVALYDSRQRTVLAVRPGITDPATLEFRDESHLLAGRSDPESYYVQQIMPRKLELNRRYIERRNLLTDIRVIVLTITRVLLPERGRSASPVERVEVRREAERVEA